MNTSLRPVSPAPFPPIRDSGKRINESEQEKGAAGAKTRAVRPFVWIGGTERRQPRDAAPFSHPVSRAMLTDDRRPSSLPSTRRQPYAFVVPVSFSLSLLFFSREPGESVMRGRGMSVQVGAKRQAHVNDASVRTDKLVNLLREKFHGTAETMQSSTTSSSTSREQAVCLFVTRPIPFYPVFAPTPGVTCSPLPCS